MNFYFFLLIFIQLPLFFSQINPFSREYTFQGQCPPDLDSDEHHCLSFQNSSLLNFLKMTQSNTSCLTSLNELVQDVSPNLYFKHSLDDNIFGLYSKSWINVNDNLLSLNAKAIISNEKIDRKIAFPGLGPRSFFYQELDFANSPFDFKEEFKFIHNFFVYFGYLDHYIYKADLLCLPTDIEIPLFTSSFYETEYLLDEDLVFIVHERKVIKDLYYYFKKVMNVNYEVEHRKVIFRGEEEPSLEDFIYVYYIIKSRIYFDTDKKKLYLPPFVHYMRSDSSITKKSGILLQTEFKNNMINFKTKRKYMENNEILRSLPTLSNRNLLIYKGMVPDENDINCFEIELFDEKLAKEMGEKSKHCISLRNLYKFRYFFVMGTLLNLNEKAKKKCEGYLQYLITDKKPEEERVLEEMIDGKFCPFVQWDRKDIWANAKLVLIEIVQAMEGNVKAVEDYLEFRKKKALSDRNAVLFKKYYEENLELVLRIQEEIKFYEDLNRERTKGTKGEL